jgi:hypothetical protein
MENKKTLQNNAPGLSLKLSSFWEFDDWNSQAQTMILGALRFFMICDIV